MRKRVIILFMILAFVLAGCENRESDKERDKEIDSGYNYGDEITEMTDEEISLLCGIYVNEDKIREGILHDYQKQALEEFRMAKEYLQKKYPGYIYDFYKLSPSDKFQSYTEIEFNIAEDPGYYNVRVELVDNEYRITDNFYSYVLEPAYSKMLKQKLSEAGLSDFGVYTELLGLVGENIDADTTVDELLASHGDIKTNITVWVDMSGHDEMENQRTVALIEDNLRELEIYGGHIVYFQEGIVDNCPTFWDLVEYRKKDTIVSVNFNTFDIH